MMVTLISNSPAPVTGYGIAMSTSVPNRTFQATVVGTGAVSATVVIEGSNDNTNFLTVGTITLAGTSVASDGFVSNASWGITRARVSAIAGTDAMANVQMGA